MGPILAPCVTQAGVKLYETCDLRKRWSEFHRGDEPFPTWMNNMAVASGGRSSERDRLIEKFQQGVKIYFDGRTEAADLSTPN